MADKAQNQVTKDILIGKLVELYPETIEVLLESGMHCLGCPASQGETLEEACIVHGLDPDEVLAAVNDKLAECNG
ncbi:MAG: DUF1858 domain-containing protein [Clostridia bacterium]|nr:DUF1858 domain-containing protein [Clostridia bacterium]